MAQRHWHELLYGVLEIEGAGGGDLNGSAIDERRLGDAGGNVGEGDVLDGGPQGLSLGDFAKHVHALADTEWIDFEFDQASVDEREVGFKRLTDQKLIHWRMTGEKQGDANQVVDKVNGFGVFLVNPSEEPVGEDLHFSA